MQLALPIDDRHRILAALDRGLRAHFGPPEPFWPLDPVSQLVLGVIGGRTYGAVSQQALLALAERFCAWDWVRDAPVAEIRKAIQVVTFPDAKAGHLKAALQAITAARGGLTLDFLGALAVDEALAWLERLPGVGRKTAAATLNFSTLLRRALVIDTHHLRVLQRWGLVGPRADARKAYGRVVPYLPVRWTADDFSDHHRLVKVLGQRICRHARPLCGHCPVRGLCPSATGRGPVGAAASGSRRTAAGNQANAQGDQHGAGQ